MSSQKCAVDLVELLTKSGRMSNLGADRPQPVKGRLMYNTADGKVYYGADNSWVVYTPEARNLIVSRDLSAPQPQVTPQETTRAKFIADLKAKGIAEDAAAKAAAKKEAEAKAKKDAADKVLADAKAAADAKLLAELEARRKEAGRAIEAATRLAVQQQLARKALLAQAQ